MTLAQQVGAELRRIRNGRSMREIAERLGCTKETVQKLETGAANPTLGRLERAAAAYDVELSIRAKAARKGDSGYGDGQLQAVGAHGPPDPADAQP